jgi:hypothetical protein
MGLSTAVQHVSEEPVVPIMTRLLDALGDALPRVPSPPLALVLPIPIVTSGSNNHYLGTALLFDFNCRLAAT